MPSQPGVGYLGGGYLVDWYCAVLPRHARTRPLTLTLPAPKHQTLTRTHAPHHLATHSHT